LTDWVSACANVTPKLEDHMEEMLEAMDPANCIEEEYHPKHDTKYCWKGLRLFVRTQLDVMDSVADGSFETAVKKFTDLKKGRASAASQSDPKAGSAGDVDGDKGDEASAKEATSSADVEMSAATGTSASSASEKAAGDVDGDKGDEASAKDADADPDADAAGKKRKRSAEEEEKE
jgi:hypothetical protein